MLYENTTYTQGTYTDNMYVYVYICVYVYIAVSLLRT